MCRFKKGEPNIPPWVQCMAVWIPDNVRGQAAFDFVEQCAGRLDGMLKGNPYEVIKAGCKKDLERYAVWASGALFSPWKAARRSAESLKT